MLFSLLGSGAAAPLTPLEIVGGRPERLTAAYWIDRLPAPDDMLMTPAKIQAFNRRSLSLKGVLTDVTELPDALPGEALRDAIRQLGDRIDFHPFRPDGTPYAQTEVAEWLANLNRSAIGESNPVKFALITRRAQMRRFPVSGPVRDQKLHPVVDKFDETAAFPGEAAAILHDSRDRRWALVRRGNYLAWMPSDALAVGGREAVRAYRNAADFLVVTAAGIAVAPPRGGQYGKERLQLDMGLRFPLLRERIDAAEDNAYRIAFPVRAGDGSLALEPVVIPRDPEVREGYLPYTRRNIIAQAFRFLGEPYGWGDAGNTRDCSGLALAVYSSLGLLMARNTADQEYGMAGQNTDFRDCTPEERRKIFAALLPGDLLYTPTHVMIVLGRDAGETYAIHDVIGGWFRPETAAPEAPPELLWLNAVTVTPLERFFDSPEGRPLLFSLRTAKRLVLSGMPTR